MLKIAKERLNDLYAKINESMGLFIPIKRAGEVNYAVWAEGKEVSLETLKTNPRGVGVGLAKLFAVKSICI